jgi:Rieske Fe-S protein
VAARPDFASVPGVICEACPRRTGNEARVPDPPPLPIGIVRRVGRIDPSDPEEDRPVDETRRNLLKFAVVVGVVAAGAAGGAAALRYFEPAVSTSAPRVQLLYQDGSPVLASQYRYSPSDTDLIVFNYPLMNEPNLLLNLGVPAPNGVGPSSGLVAYSALCEHVGCGPPSLSYYPAGTCGSFYAGKAILHCICHGSTYDPAQAASGGGAAIVTGPTELALPQVLLDWDPTTDFLFAVGVLGPPVYGHTSSLTGGPPVTSPAMTQAPQTPVQQCPT